MEGSLREARHRYCCVDRAMTQASVGTIPDSAARCKFAWYLRAISEALLPRDRDGSLPAPLPCPANPISGRARPILDQRTHGAHATSVNDSLTGISASALGVARAPTRHASRFDSACTPLLDVFAATANLLARDGDVRHRAAPPDYIGAKARLLNGFFAISVNSPSMSMVNFCCCVGSAPKAVRSVTRRVTPQPMRAAV
jgi:hypothetical protein